MTKRPKLDAGSIDRLLDGSLNADDAPPELAAVAGLLAAAADVPAAATADPSFIAALAAEVNAAPTTAISSRRKPVLAKFLTIKAGVLAGVLVFGAAGAAAATNSLPGAAQHGVATAAKHVGINLPDSANDHARAATTKDKPNSHANANSDEPTSTTEDHGKPADNHGADVSKVAHNTDTTGADHGAAVCDVASGGKCTDNRGSGGEDHGSSTTVTTPQNHDGGATNDAGDHSGDNGSQSTPGSEGSSHSGGSDSSSGSGGH